MRSTGTSRASATSLEAGSRIRVRPRAPEPVASLSPTRSVAFAIAYEDEHLIVVDKPAGLVVHPARGHTTGTLVHGLLGHAAAGGDDPTRPGIVHRLDRDTSGLMVVARSERVHRRLQRMLRDRRIERRYLVAGARDAAAGVQRRPPDRPPPARPAAHGGRARGQPGAMRSRTSACSSSSDGVAFCEARLETGRTHQIRVHLEAAGFPVRRRSGLRPSGRPARAGAPVPARLPAGVRPSGRRTRPDRPREPPAARSGAQRRPGACAGRPVAGFPARLAAAR